MGIRSQPLFSKPITYFLPETPVLFGGVHLRIKPLFSQRKTPIFYPRSLNVTTSYHPKLTVRNIAIH